ncbi:hypothetical protein [Streptomyces sirii]|uniref:hypothetical protein n=1 Tax=Streptomyces sirii TaxID=3127701 RepID=UPI003D3629C0
MSCTQSTYLDRLIAWYVGADEIEQCLQTRKLSCLKGLALSALKLKALKKAGPCRKKAGLAPRMYASRSSAAGQNDDPPKVFENRIPSDTPEWFKPIAPGTALSRSGNYAYVVLENGELVIGKRTAGHVSIAGGGRYLLPVSSRPRAVRSSSSTTSPATTDRTARMPKGPPSMHSTRTE